MMQKRRIHKKKCKKQAGAVPGGIADSLDRQEKVMGEILEQFRDQQEILDLYYKTYLEMKKQNQKKYLLTYIRMRDEMEKDIGRMKEQGGTNEETSRLLGIYIEEYNTLPEDNGVEILTCRENEEFVPKLQKPLKRVDVCSADLNNKVVQVYGHGYMWNGIVLKKTEVAVGVYNK